MFADACIAAVSRLISVFYFFFLVFRTVLMAACRQNAACNTEYIVMNAGWKCGKYPHYYWVFIVAVIVSAVFNCII